MRFSRFLDVLVFALVLTCSWLSASGQKVNQAPSWQQMTRQSGYIFSAKVTAIEHVPQRNVSGVSTMQITFQVEEAILGVHTGQTLVIHEWAGLWDSPQRYRAGEHVLLFLYPPGKLGLTSPVGGSVGRFEIDSAGTLVLDRGRTNPLASNLPRPGSTDLPLRGKSRISTLDFARAIRRAVQE